MGSVASNIKDEIMDRAGKVICPDEAPAASLLWPNLSGDLVALNVVAILLGIGTWGLYILQLFWVHKYVGSHRVSRKVQWLIGTFPIASTCSVVAVSVPRSIPFMNTFILLYVARALFTFVELIRNLFGDYDQMSSAIRETETINMASRPVCCCCVCLPKLPATPRNIWIIETLVLQMSYVRIITLFITVVLLADDGKNIDSVFVKAVDYITGISTLVAMYGATILFTIARKSLSLTRLRVMFTMLQLLLLFVNLQGAILDILASENVIKCTSFVQGSTIAKMIQHYLLVLEVFILDLLLTFLLNPYRSAVFDKHESQSLKAETPNPGQYGGTGELAEGDTTTRERPLPLNV